MTRDAEQAALTWDEYLAAQQQYREAVARYQTARVAIDANPDLPLARHLWAGQARAAMAEASAALTDSQRALSRLLIALGAAWREPAAGEPLIIWPPA